MEWTGKRQVQQEPRDIRLARVIHPQPIQNHGLGYAHREERIERFARERPIEVEGDVGREGEAWPRKVQPAGADPVMQLAEGAARRNGQHHYLGGWKALGFSECQLDRRRRARHGFQSLAHDTDRGIRGHGPKSG